MKRFSQFSHLLLLRIKRNTEKEQINYSFEIKFFLCYNQLAKEIQVKKNNKTASMPVGVVFIFNHIDFYFFSAIIEI